MDVDEAPKNVLAASGTTGSVSVSLHPLVIMNISEHWTRVKAQEGSPLQGKYSIQVLRNVLWSNIFSIIIFIIM